MATLPMASITVSGHYFYYERMNSNLLSNLAYSYSFADHSYSPCLGERLGDTGSSHSPVYGFSTDGYPIYGPYQSNGQLATSCWQKRDYNSPIVGCTGGARTCTLTDPLDYTKGTTSVTSGPSLTGTVSTQSGNTIQGSSGIYKQDYFYNFS